MRIAWDLQAVTGPRPTGLGQSVRLLLDAFREYEPGVGFLGLPPNNTNSPLSSVRDRLLWEQLRLPSALRAAIRKPGAEAQPELLYSPALGVPLSCPVPRMAHVHDLIPLRFPQQFSGWAGWYWKKMLPGGWRRCAALTVSNSWLVREVSTHLGYPAERIHVVPYYPDPQLAALADEMQPGWMRRRTPPEPLFLCLGSHELRKNFALAIEALSLLRTRVPAARLRIIGGESAHTAELQDFARRAGVAQQVEFIGYAERRELVRQMLGATALLFVSRYEGYGMPPQEAQSLGLPVVLSDIPCHRAVYDDPARLSHSAPAGRPTAFVDPGDAGALAAEMQALAADAEYWQQLSSAGLLYQQSFSAMETAGALRRAFEQGLAFAAKATSGV
ncbi:glycosyltransferase family 4 protein [bacterium]|nr:glycosyltransferase family 4 protein [bacterium]